MKRIKPYVANMPKEDMQIYISNLAARITETKKYINKMPRLYQNEIDQYVKDKIEYPLIVKYFMRKFGKRKKS